MYQNGWFLYWLDDSEGEVFMFPSMKDLEGVEGWSGANYNHWMYIYIDSHDSDYDYVTIWLYTFYISVVYCIYMI